MALKSRVVDYILHLVSTPRLKLAVTLAAVSFAICHVAVMATTATPVGITADLDEIPRQLMHFAAVLGRFVLPLGFMAAGFATRAKAAPVIQSKR